MADRICSLCGKGYTDETRHNYDECVDRCKDILLRVQETRRTLSDAREHLKEAKRIQKQDWWIK